VKISETFLQGLMIIEPKVWTDDRGFFYELFHQERYEQFGIPHFVQDNISRSKQGVLRGLHYQIPQAQGKLVWVTSGEVWDIVVDIRLTSKTFGQWISILLSDENHKQLYIPPGFAHGFCVLSKNADLHYKCTNFYAPKAEQGILWNDKQLNIPWPIENPIISAKDQILPTFNEIAHDKLFP
jgi:dTDP-4-dehydrorhamnose 3,5-epimerase